MTLNEAARHHVQTFSDNLSNLPELQIPRLVADKEPRPIIKAFVQYQRVIERLFNLSREEVNIIQDANKRLNAERSHPKTSAADLLVVLSDENRKLLISGLRQISNPLSSEYHPALDDLADRMTRAQTFKKTGKTPTDGDPESDKVIWGYTKISDPGTHSETIEHFVLLHFMERYATQILKPKNVSLASQKDYLLNAMTDVICLEEAKKPGHSPFSPLFSIWSRAKKDGGLGWINEKRWYAYKMARIKALAVKNH